jgi:hypothetical protein
LTPLEDKCVVCGATQSLTKHHVVPRCYRKHFPDKLKSRTHHDVLCLCIDDHMKYEVEADKLKEELRRTLQIEPKKAKSLLLERYCHTLVTYQNVIPKYKQETMIKRICDFLNVDQVSETEIKRLAKERTKRHFDSAPAEQYMEVVQALGPAELIGIWRRHFLESMKPEHLPEHWSVDHSVDDLLKRHWKDDE